MSIYKIKIDINKSAHQWYNLLMKENANDFILFESDLNKLIWFITNYTQFLIRQGGNEVIQLYGNAIINLETFVYQTNLSMPVGYKLKPDINALYDLLLNFETEPDYRFLIWNDADNLLQVNTTEFSEIFERLIVSAYCNRNGISTIKEDGSLYTVDQRNMLVFNRTNAESVMPLLQNEYFVPSISKEGNSYKVIDFNLIELVEGDL